MLLQNLQLLRRLPQIKVFWLCLGCPVLSFLSLLDVFCLSCCIDLFYLTSPGGARHLFFIFYFILLIYLFIYLFFHFSVFYFSVFAFILFYLFIFTRGHPAHPVSAPILPPREIQARLWSPKHDRHRRDTAL